MNQDLIEFSENLYLSFRHKLTRRNRFSTAKRIIWYLEDQNIFVVDGVLVEDAGRQVLSNGTVLYVPPEEKTNTKEMDPPVLKKKIIRSDGKEYLSVAEVKRNGFPKVSKFIGSNEEYLGYRWAYVE